jgi:hypothetical protein
MTNNAKKTVICHALNLRSKKDLYPKDDNNPPVISHALNLLREKDLYPKDDDDDDDEMVFGDEDFGDL